MLGPYCVLKSGITSAKMFSTVLWSSVHVPLTLSFFWSIDYGLLYYPWLACSYTRCTLDRIMEMNIGLKGS